eukprot:TRINITY_DN8210_c0_g1_i1.p1 TRINITY_DN8210_c0_g1~~TRINITY_DN8210_c0_g1_i1.p1  ORF type:complete len:500 (+),score=95.17 TRINITY_DN8210_c0_g1_i1:75-1574(+)
MPESAQLVQGPPPTAGCPAPAQGCATAPPPPLPVSGQDQQLTEFGSCRCFVWKERLDMADLRRALESTVAEQFPYLAGHFETHADGRVRAVASGRTPGWSAEVVQSEELSLILKEDCAAVRTDPRFEPYFPPAVLDVKDQGQVCKIAVSVFEPIGYTLLAVTATHAHFDGGSMAHFLAHWSRRCTPKPGAPRTPRQELRPASFERPLAAVESIIGTPALRQLAEASVRSTEYGAEFGARSRDHRRALIRLTPEQLRALKEACSPADQGSWISLNEAIYAAAVLARQIAAAEGGTAAHPSAPFTLAVTINLRGRSNLFPASGRGTEPLTVANCIVSPGIEITAPPAPGGHWKGAALQAAAREAAATVHRAVRELVADTSLLERTYSVPDFHLRSGVLGQFQRRPHFDVMKSYGLTVNSWRGFDWFENFFGAREPAGYMSMSPKLKVITYPRMVLVCPNTPAGGAELLVILQEAEIRALGRVLADLSGADPGDIRVVNDDP